MKRSRFSDQQIQSILQAARQGTPVKILCQQYGMSVPTFYKWRARFAGLDNKGLKRLRKLEEDRRQLKKQLEESQRKLELLQESLRQLLPKPAQRRPLARNIRQRHKLSIRMVCETFDISETCYRYQPRLPPSRWAASGQARHKGG